MIFNYLLRKLTCSGTRHLRAAYYYNDFSSELSTVFIIGGIIHNMYYFMCLIIDCLFYTLGVFCTRIFSQHPIRMTDNLLQFGSFPRQT